VHLLTVQSLIDVPAAQFVIRLYTTVYAPTVQTHDYSIILLLTGYLHISTF